MLTIKQILDDKEAVIRGLEKKNFKNAAETIEQVLEIDNKRKAAQSELDALLAEIKTLSKSIGMLMKEGKRGEEFLKVKEKIKNYCESYQKEMAAAGIFKENIISRLLGLKDKKEVENTGEGLRIVVNSEEEKQKLESMKDLQI